MPLRVPKLFNLRTDPFERADITSNTYYDWFHRQRLHRTCSHLRDEAVPRHARRVPAAPEGGHVHDRPGDREARGDTRQRAVDAGRVGATGDDSDSGRGVPHGLGPPLPGGGARPHRVGRRVLDRPLPGHEPAVRGVRRADRLRRGGGTAARSRRFPGSARREPRAGLARVHDHARPRRPPAPEPVVDVDARRELAAAERPGRHARARGRRARRPRRP